MTEWSWYQEGDFAGPWECAPAADCLRMMRLYANELLLVEEEGGKVRLLVDNGRGVWRQDDSRVSELVLATTRAWHRESADAGLDRKTAADVARRAVSTTWSKVREEVLGSVATVAGWMADTESWPPGLTRVTQSDLNRPGSPFIGAPNGVIDLVTGQVLTGAEARAALVTRTLPDDYDPNVRHPAVDQLLGYLSPANRAWVLGSIGWGMRGNGAGRFYFLEGYGVGPLVGAVTAALGDYAEMVQGRGSGRGRARQRPDSPLVFMDVSPKNGVDWGDADASHTMFYCTKSNAKVMPPPMLTEAFYDRVALLDLPPIPDRRRDIELCGQLLDPEARQALAAQVIAHAMRNMDGPPADTPDVAANRARMRRVSLGKLGVWMIDHLVQTSDPADILTTDEVWEAAREAAADADTGHSVDLVWGMPRRQLTDFLKQQLQLSPTRGRVNGKICHFWRGVALLSDEEIGQDAIHEIPGPLVYCRICKVMVLEVEVTTQSHQHAQEELASDPFLCFYCKAPIPDENPYLLTCLACDRRSNSPSVQLEIIRAMSLDMGLHA